MLKLVSLSTFLEDFRFKSCLAIERDTEGRNIAPELVRPGVLTILNVNTSLRI